MVITAVPIANAAELAAPKDIVLLEGITGLASFLAQIPHSRSPPVYFGTKRVKSQGYQTGSIYLMMVMNVNYQRIKDLREDHDLTQQEVADFLKISRSAYSNYENFIRDISAETLARLADFYDTSVDYLMGRTDTPAPYPSKKT